MDPVEPNMMEVGRKLPEGTLGFVVSHVGSKSEFSSSRSPSSD